MEEIIFESKNHCNLILDKLITYKHIYPNNQIETNYLVAYYLLCSDLLREKSEQWIDKDGIDFNKIKASCYSNGELLMAKVAYSLYTDKKIEISFSDLACSLSSDNLNLVLCAIKLRQLNNHISLLTDIVINSEETIDGREVRV